MGSKSNVLTLCYFTLCFVQDCSSEDSEGDTALESSPFEANCSKRTPGKQSCTFSLLPVLGGKETNESGRASSSCSGVQEESSRYR